MKNKTMTNKILCIIKNILGVVAFSLVVLVLGNYVLSYGFSTFNACEKCDVSSEGESFKSCSSEYFPEVIQELNFEELNFSEVLNGSIN